MPRFVVLTHDHPVWHWDFMLEQEAALRTWRLEAEPAAGCGCTASLLPDHRREYLTYEGPVSGGRGEVRRWDHGEYVVLADTPERIEVQLRGAKLKGRAVLSRAGDASLWAFSFDSGSTSPDT